MGKQSARKKRSGYDELVLRAVAELAQGCGPENYPTQVAIADKVAVYKSGEDPGSYTGAQVQSSVSRSLARLSSGEIQNEKQLLLVGKKRYAPNIPKHIRRINRKSVIDNVRFGRPEVFVSARVVDEPSTATLIVDISDTDHEVAEAVFKEYLGPLGFWILPVESYLQLMIIGSEDKVSAACNDIKKLVREAYNNKLEEEEKKKKQLKRKKVSQTETVSDNAENSDHLLQN